MRHVIADGYVFVRSSELNRAIGAVTIEQLMFDHRQRLVGEATTDHPFNPYEFDPSKEPPATSDPVRGSNQLGGVDTGLPTRKERVLAIQNTLGAAIDQLKALGELEFVGTELEDTAEGVAPDAEET